MIIPHFSCQSCEIKRLPNASASLTAKSSPFALTPTFRSVSLECSNRLVLLGIEISTNINFHSLSLNIRQFQKNSGSFQKWGRTSQQRFLVYSKHRSSRVWNTEPKHLGRRWNMSFLQKGFLVTTYGSSNIVSYDHRHELPSLWLYYRIHSGCVDVCCSFYQ